MGQKVGDQSFFKERERVQDNLSLNLGRREGGKISGFHRDGRGVENNEEKCNSSSGSPREEDLKTATSPLMTKRRNAGVEEGDPEIFCKL